MMIIMTMMMMMIMIMMIMTMMISSYVPPSVLSRLLNKLQEVTIF